MKKYKKISESQQDLMPAFYIAYKKGDLELFSEFIKDKKDKFVNDSYDAIYVGKGDEKFLDNPEKKAELIEFLINKT